MLDYLYLLPALPLSACLVLALLGRRLSHRTVAWLGVAPVGVAAGLAVAVAAPLFTGPTHRPFRQSLWTWLTVGDLRVDVAFYLDPLSAVMAATVAGVAFLVLLYATEYMADDAGFARFFAYMNLFVAAMLVLVLADNLLLLYLGWEGVGLCSFLLIGFWKHDPANVRAAWKAFLVTRVGDTALLVALVGLLATLGTLDIQALPSAARNAWPSGAALPTLAAALLLVAAAAKSAQWPLHIWLPDAMAGPTPVSALLHAATMVTAGVYLLARFGGLLALAPAVQAATAAIGAITLLLGGLAAVVQTDLKRALAYSTMSQIGYMFAAAGVGATAAATFHVFTHAFFKSLLFLAAGSVMLAVGHSSDLSRMGGLRRTMPLVYVAFVIGAAALSGLPFFSGFFSKEAVLQALWLHGLGGRVLWAVGVAGAFLTALYAFGLVFRAFHGPASRGAGVPSACGEGILPSQMPPVGTKFPMANRTQARRPRHARPTWAAKVPLAVLAGLSVLAGYVHGAPAATVWALPSAAVTAALAGVLAAWWMTRPSRTAGQPTHAAFVKPLTFLARINRYGAADRAWRTIAHAGLTTGETLATTQTGRLRHYAAILAATAVLALLLTVLM